MRRGDIAPARNNSVVAAAVPSGSFKATAARDGGSYKNLNAQPDIVMRRAVNYRRHLGLRFDGLRIFPRGKKNSTGAEQAAHNHCEKFSEQAHVDVTTAASRLR